MSNRIVNRKNTIALASAVCAASIGLFGCGSDSKGSGPNAQGDVCTADQTGNTLTVKNDVNGVVTTTIYEFGDDGNMASQSTVTDVGAGGESACNAMNVEGVSEASFEGGKCTVKTTAGLMPGSIDQLEQTQQMACDAANEAVKPASTDSGNKNPFAKSSNSSGNGGMDGDDICSVTKTSSTVTIKTNVDGEAYTTVFVFAGGELTSVVSTADLSAIGDDVTAEAVCNAYAKGGATAKYDMGKCTVTEDADFYGSMTFDEIYELNVESCDEMKAAANPANGGDEGTTPGSSDSGSITKSSASAGPKEKVVTFEDGIMYTSTYGDRVRTFFNTVDEYTFFDDNAVTRDSSGWWFSFNDQEDGGTSMVFAGSEMGSYTAEIDLVYDWYYNGEYMESVPYPYGAIGFNLSPVGSAVDMSDWEGICVTYSATKPVAFTLKSSYDGRSSWYTKLPSATVKTLDIAFTTTVFHQPTWAIEQSVIYPTFANAKSKVVAIHFKYSNDEAGVTCSTTSASCTTTSINSIKIHKLGKYGACGS